MTGRDADFGSVTHRSVRTDGGETGGRSVDGMDEVGDREIIPRDELEKTEETEYGPTYRCPRCGWEWVHEYCDCPECLWAGMAQEGWE